MPTEPDGTGEREPADAPPDARRITVGFDRVERWLAGVVTRHGPLRWTVSATLLTAQAQDGTRLWLDVPFPPLATHPDGAPAAATTPARTADAAEAAAAPAQAGAETAEPPPALLDHIGRRRRIGLVLVRRGGFGVAVFDGPDLVASKVGSSYVQGTTKAGGWSQQRFARRRDNQARSAFASAADQAARVVLPVADSLDAIVCGGDRGAVDAVLADPRLGALLAKRGGPWLAVPDPRRAVVDEAPKQFLAMTIRIHP